MRIPVVEIVWNTLRGVLIALAELVPGVSGGTLALVVGVYERVLHAGSEMISAVRLFPKDRRAALAKFRSLDWWLLIPMGVGMLSTVLLFAGVMSRFVENQPEISRGLFLGMVAASLIVPLRMVDRGDLAHKKLSAGVLVAVAAVAAFVGTSFTSAPRVNPPLFVFFFAAMVAICALVLPGVSGSFLLLTLGLYGPVTAAVDERNLPIIATFAAGALTGLVLFIKVLTYLLTSHRTLTLVTMAGLMLGSLRALWPWQTAHAELLTPHGNWFTVLLMIVLGACIVLGLLWAEKRVAARVA